MHPFQFSELTYLTAREISGSVVQEGSVLGTHSTTTTQDSYRSDDADYWNDGTIWIVDTTDDLAPLWESKIVRDYAADGTITHDALTAAAGNGDRYALCKRRYPKWLLEEAVNHAVMRLGPVPRTDITSLTTADGQTEYALPLVANPDLRQVFIQMVTDDSNDNKWEEILNWSVKHGDPGTGDVLLFDRQYPASRAIMLVYMARHARLNDDTDTLQEDIPIELVIYPAALYALKWYRDRTRTNDFKQAIDDMSDLVAENRVTFQVPQPQRPNKILTVDEYIRNW